MRRAIRVTAVTVVAILALVGVAIAWLLATESGARWLLAQALPRLPGALQITEVHGTLLRGIDFRDVRWNDDTVDVLVDRFDTQFELLPLLKRRVQVSKLDIRNVNVLVRDTPSSDTGGPPFSLDLPIALQIGSASIKDARIETDGNELIIEQVWLGGELSGSSLRIDRLDINSELGDISLSGHGRLSGAYPATATAAWDLRLPDQAPLSGIIRVRGDTSRYELEHDLDAPYAISTSGTLSVIGDEVVVDLTNTWQLIHVDAGDAGSLDIVDGTFNIGGTPREFTFEGDTTILSGDIPALVVAAHGRGDVDRIDFASVSVSNDWGQLLASGELIVSPQPAWRIDFELADLDPAVADQRFSGDLRISGRTLGRIVDGQPLADVRLDEISGDLNEYPVNGSADLSLAEGEFQVEDAIFRVGDNRITFDGSYGKQLEATAALRFSDLSQFGIGAVGLLNGDLLIASDLKTFQASGNLEGEQLGWQDYIVDTLAAEFDLPAVGDGTALLNISTTDQGHLSIEVGGRFADNRWTGAVRSLAIRNPQLGDWSLREPADFSVSRSKLSLARTCFGTSSNTGLACAMLEYDSSGPLRFDTSINELPLAAMPLDLPEGATLKGMIEAHASGEYANDRLTAKTGMKINDLGLNASFEGDEVVANFTHAFASAAIVDNRLTGELDLKLENAVDHVTGTIEIGNLFDRRSSLLGNGSLELHDLSLLSFFYPDVANPIGTIVGRVDVSGSMTAPEIVGEVALTGGSVDIRRAGISVTEIELLLRQREAGQLSLRGAAKSDDGYLELVGDTSISSDTGIRTEVQLRGENFTLIRLPDWRVTASPSIDVLFDEQVTRVTGALGIPSANISIHTVPETTERASPDVVVHRKDEVQRAPRRQLYVDVKTDLGEEVFFSGFGLSTGLEGSVRITGGTTTPYRSLGRVVLRGGRYKAYGQNLEIETGELIFNGPLTNPALNIRATRTASDETIAGISLSGTPANLESEVFSEPALADAEALSYLLTGRPLANANSEEGDMLNQAAFALGLSTAGSVAARIRDQLGLETLGVQGTAENRQLVAGARFGSRLFIEYAYGVVDNLGTLLLRYQLSSRLVVESRSGSVRNVDIVYSVKKP